MLKRGSNRIIRRWKDAGYEFQYIRIVEEILKEDGKYQRI